MLLKIAEYFANYSANNQSHHSMWHQEVLLCFFIIFLAVYLDKTNTRRFLLPYPLQMAIKDKNIGIYDRGYFPLR